MIVNSGAVRVESNHFSRALVPGAKYRDKSLPPDETENPRDAAEAAGLLLSSGAPLAQETTLVPPILRLVGRSAESLATDPAAV
jgi:hypothetical protein